MTRFTSRKKIVRLVKKIVRLVRHFEYSSTATRPVELLITPSAAVKPGKGARHGVLLRICVREKSPSKHPYRRRTLRLIAVIADEIPTAELMPATETDIVARLMACGKFAAEG